MQAPGRSLEGVRAACRIQAPPMRLANYRFLAVQNGGGLPRRWARRFTLAGCKKAAASNAAAAPPGQKRIGEVLASPGSQQGTRR